MLFKTWVYLKNKNLVKAKKLKSILKIRHMVSNHIQFK